MIIVSPTAVWLKESLAKCKKSLTIASPYVGDILFQEVSKLDRKISVTLLTRTALPDFASGASDFDAIVKLADHCGAILSLRSLHAKVYIVDAHTALVTSANATYSGMFRNQECGVQTQSATEVSTLEQLVKTGFGSSPQPKSWKADELEALRPAVNVLRMANLREVATRQVDLHTSDSPILLTSKQLNRLAAEMPGWLNLTFSGLLAIPTNVFTLSDVYEVCAPMVKLKYPENRNSRPKLRQQLQRLRDLGMLSFLGKGRYTKHFFPT